jgi:hypothetical protein
MSWHFLPALVGASSEPRSSAGGPSAEWKAIPSAGKSSCGVRGTACFPCSRSGTTSGPSTALYGLASWMSSLVASRVSLGASPGNGRARGTNGTCGPKPYGLFERCAPLIAYLKTLPGSGRILTSVGSSKTFPRAGTVCAGTVFPLPPAAPLTGGTASGSWPSPSARDWKESGFEPAAQARKSPCLPAAVRMWPTPRARLGDPKRGSPSPALARRRLRSGRRNLDDVVLGGQLNPDWVEWLMGWPIGWTGLEPLATGRYRRWSRQHGGF